MSFQLKSSESNVICGLGTLTHTALNSQIYFISVVSFVTPPSGLTITINQNGSPIATGTISSNRQQILSLQVSPVVITGDVFSIVLSSSTSNDLMLNTLKSIAVITPLFTQA